MMTERTSFYQEQAKVKDNWKACLPLIQKEEEDTKKIMGDILALESLITNPKDVGQLTF